ncbi:MAG: divalent-cation tolerance protein CutA [Bacteroidota bacterium]
MEARWIYITCKDTQEAQQIGRALVEERLVACVNILPGMQSLYWWEGKVVSDQETVMIAKTDAKKVAALTDRVKELHSYEVPCVIALPIQEGNPDYLQWISDSLSPIS